MICRKYAYDSRDQALCRARHIMTKHHHAYEVFTYRCRCGKWHLSGVNPSNRSA